MRFSMRKRHAGHGPPTIRVVAELGAEGRHLVVAAEVDDRTVYMVWEEGTENTIEDSEVFESAAAAVDSWLRSHPWTPEQLPEECVVCDADTVYALGFAGTSDFVFASLRDLGVSEATTRTIVEADARVKGRELEHGPPFETIVGVPVCTNCADRAGLRVAMIGGKVPTYGMTAPRPE